MKYKVPPTQSSDYLLPPFPNTWYPVCMTNEIKPNQIYSHKIAGHDIVVYRNNKDTDEIIIQSKYCPHMGVDLTYGTIRKDCIVCPFHHHCIHPKQANTAIQETNKKVYSVEQVANIVFVWIGITLTPTVSIKALMDTYYQDTDTTDPQLYKLFERKVGGHLVDYAEHLLDVSHAPHTHGVELVPVEDMLKTTEHSFFVTFRIKKYNLEPKFHYLTPTFGYVDYGYNMRTFMMFVVEDVGQIRMIQVPIWDRTNYQNRFQSLLAATYTHFDFSEEAAFFSTKRHRNRSLTKAEQPMDNFREWFLRTYYSEKQIQLHQTW